MNFNQLELPSYLDNFKNYSRSTGRNTERKIDNKMKIFPNLTKATQKFCEIDPACFFDKQSYYFGVLYMLKALIYFVIE